MLNGKTYRCRATTQLEVDHVKGRDDHTLANLATLCRHHHQIKTSREARATQLSRGKRPGVVHHGLRNAKKTN
jgi:5-methylcytosine-specific restriction endonuclease McrA